MSNGMLQPKQKMIDVFDMPEQVLRHRVGYLSRSWNIQGNRIDEAKLDDDAISLERLDNCFVEVFTGILNSRFVSIKKYTASSGTIR